MTAQPTQERLAMSHLWTLMPEIVAAQAAFDLALDAATSNRDVAACAKVFNAVLRKAIDALYLDTADRNRRSTFESVYGKPASHCLTLFGQNPAHYLRTQWLSLSE